MAIDRSTIWPYDETASRATFYYSRYGEPDRRRGGARARRARRRRRAALPVGHRRDDGARARAAEAGRHDRARRGLLLRHGRRRSRRSSAGACATSSSTRPGAPPDGVQLVWLEAPSNPFLTMPDLEAAAAHPAPVVVDSTAATPVHLRPLEHGADFVAAQRDEVPRGPRRRAARRGRLPGRRRRRTSCARFRTRHGHRRRARPGLAAAPRPEDARGPRRAARRRSAGATRRAPARRTRRCETVRYPGFGGLLSFDVADGDAARRVETSTRVIVNATSLGGVTSVMESRARWEGDRVPAGPPPAERRPRGCRGPLGRPRRRPRASASD